VLLSLTGASPQLGEPPPSPLVDSVSVVRADLARVLLVVAAMLLVNFAICYAAQKAFVPHIARKVPPSKLLPIRTFVRTVPLVIAALSPLAACALAATYARLTGRRTS